MICRTVWTSALPFQPPANALCAARFEVLFEGVAEFFRKVLGQWGQRWCRGGGEVGVCQRFVEGFAKLLFALGCLEDVVADDARRADDGPGGVASHAAREGGMKENPGASVWMRKELIVAHTAECSGREGRGWHALY